MSFTPVMTKLSANWLIWALCFWKTTARLSAKTFILLAFPILLPERPTARRRPEPRFCQSRKGGFPPVGVAYAVGFCRRDFDLEVSGHTHGGQIFPFHIFAKLHIKYLSGLYPMPGGAEIYVSNGAGQWAGKCAFSRRRK